MSEELFVNEFFNFDLSSSESSYTGLVMSSMSYIEGNLKSGRDTQEQNNKEIRVYSRRPKSKYKKNLAPEAPEESKSIMGSNKTLSDKPGSPPDNLHIAIRK